MDLQIIFYPKYLTITKDMQESLKEAQDLGFAEADPSFDVDGFDSLF